MKETLFRGKRIDNGEWVCGSYHYCNKEGIMRLVDYVGGNRVIKERPVHFNNHWILVHQTPDSIGWDVRQTFTPYDVISETVGQEIGLKDKNGTSIFEGDIMSGVFRTGEYGKSVRRKSFNFEIKFHIGIGGMASYTEMPKGYGNYRFCPYLTECEVVGNIFEHANLIK